MPFDFFKYDYISINNFDGALHYPFVFDFKGINALLGAHTVDVLLSGVSPLTLLNAVSLNYVKAFGKCEQASTPTPTSPVNIIANNGAIKVRHQSGLPLGYQPYEYITASGNQWLDTGIKLASTDIVEAEFKNSSTTGYGALYGVFALGDSSAFYANGTYYGYNIANGKVDTGVSVDTSWHTLRFDYANGVITLDGNDTTYTPFVFDNAKNNYLFARYYSNSYGYGFKGSCKRFKVIRNNEVICDLIPVVQLSDDAIGMYDLVNNVFYGNVGTGDFTATNPINDLEVYYDGTVETVSIDTTGSSATCQPLLSVGTYKDSQNITNGSITRNVGVKVLDGSEDWRLYSSTRDVCLYDTVDAYKPASPMAILSTHFAGSSQSTLQQSANTIRLTYGNSDFGIFSIRLEGTSADNAVDELKQFLASQYAAGTPVIVVYPLATPTIETVTGQTLTITQGTNIVTAEGSVDDLELEVSYKAYAEVTVEEIEAVNTDENVEVTIS